MKEHFLKKIAPPFERNGPTAHSLKVGGMEPFSAVDYPDHLAAVIFCQGCPWRCRYCYNAHLRPFSLEEGESRYEWEDVLGFLRNRKHLLDGVVFSGGEPLAQPRLSEAIQDVKREGFKVALHTGGYSPTHFKRLVRHLDWVGLDIKAPQGKYPQITMIPNSGMGAWQCVRLLVESGVSYECRTTVHPALLSQQDIWEMACSLSQIGVRHYVLQLFQERGCADETLASEDGAHLPLGKSLRDRLGKLFDSFTVRS